MKTGLWLRPALFFLHCAYIFIYYQAPIGLYMFHKKPAKTRVILYIFT